MLGKYQLRFGILAVLILANYLLWTAVGEADSSTLRIDFLNVGQGDAILIRTPTHQNILIDGGPDDRVVTELGKILPIWDRELDLVVATHPEADHIGGLLTVLQRYQVKEVLTPLVSNQTQTYLAWEQALTKIATVNYADAADDFEWGEVGWDTLFPLTNVAVSGTSPSIRGASSTNDDSIVAELNYREYHILFTGDMGPALETLAQQIYPSLNVQILKVAHHGSKFSSTAQWLQVIHPDTAVILVGKNSYGHPSVDALNRLQTVGADVYRTDQDGTIEMIFESNGYWVKKDGQKKFYQN